MYSYYAPSIPATFPSPPPLGMPPGPINITGPFPDCVVTCDLGRSIVGIINGAEVWRRDYPTIWPRALDELRGLIFFGRDDKIECIDPKSGYIHRVMNIPSSPAPIVGLDVRIDSGTPYLTASFGLAGPGSIRLYFLDHLNLTEIFVNPQVASHPRHACYCGGWIFVADTFGHQMYAVDVASGTYRDRTEIYYPNYIEMRSSCHTAIITAEHENRIIEWSYYPSHSRNLLAAPSIYPFNDITKEKSDIVSLESTTEDPNSTFVPKKSLCAIEAHGQNTLYSPNSARTLPDGKLLIADTDNHRIVVWDNGTVVAEATNFNNPVTAIPLDTNY